MPDRPLLLETMKAFVDRLARLAATDQVGRRRAHAGGGPETEELLARTCSEHGIEYPAYRSALAEDPGLAELHRVAVDGIVIGQVDPGPYDVISPRDPPDSSLRAHEHPSSWGEELAKEPERS